MMSSRTYFLSGRDSIVDQYLLLLYFPLSHYHYHYILLMKINNQIGKNSNSQKRAKILSDESDRIAKLFQVNNFYDNQQINVKKLKQRIIQAKRKLLAEKTSEIRHEVLENVKTMEDRKKYTSLTHQKTRRCNSRATETKQKNKYQKKVKRLVTDLGEYQMPKKLAETKSRIFGQQTPSGKDSKSVISVYLQPKKKLLSERDQVDEFQLKISLLWDLYELLIQIMQSVNCNRKLDQRLIQTYIKQISSQKYEFVHEICDIISEKRAQRTIRMSRVLQNLSVFETCLNSMERKQGASSEIINFLGYSSSSIIFMVKLLFLTHETALTLSQKTLKILNSINEFQQESYRSELRQPRQILRRMEHNNEIISILKNRCGKRHGKYCEQFVAQIIKTAQKNYYAAFNEVGNNIFQFLSFHLHFENNAGNLPLLAMPPSPFLTLKYPKTIVIQPWGVLVYRKMDKLLIRANTGKFLAEIGDDCNLIFWTQLMPKDADIITSLLPVKDNIHWLYRYHCTASLEYINRPSFNNMKNSPYVQSPKNRNSRMKTEVSVHSITSTTRLIKDLQKIGCITENTIIIDYDKNNISQSQVKNSILLPWKGEKKDVRLIQLSDEFKKLRRDCQDNKMPWVDGLQKISLKITPETKNKLRRRERLSLPKTSMI